MKALLFSIGFQPLEAASQLWLYEARLMPTGGKAPAIVDELSVSQRMDGLSAAQCL